jgi:hypothetical protein
MNESDRIGIDFGPQLPLVQVELKLSFPSPIELSAPNVIRLHAALKSEFPEFVDTPNAPETPGVTGYAMKPGRLDALALRKEQIFCFVLQHLIAIRWVSRLPGDQATYPGFETLLERLERVFSEVNAECRYEDQPFVANMNYMNFVVRDPAKTPLWFLAGHSFVGVDGDLRVERLDQVMSVSDQTDVRLFLEPAQNTNFEEGTVLLTACGTRIEGNDWNESLELVHAEVNKYFRMLLSFEAIKEWQK